MNDNMRNFYANNPLMQDDVLKSLVNRSVRREGVSGVTCDIIRQYVVAFFDPFPQDALNDVINVVVANYNKLDVIPRLNFDDCPIQSSVYIVLLQQASVFKSEGRNKDFKEAIKGIKKFLDCDPINIGITPEEKATFLKYVDTVFK